MEKRTKSPKKRFAKSFETSPGLVKNKKPTLTGPSELTGNAFEKSSKKPKNRNKSELSDDHRATSTPYNVKKNISDVKSIMKTSSFMSDPDTSDVDLNSSRRKKRVKSVSFMLEDETASKKSKSDLSSSDVSVTSSPKKGKNVSNRICTPNKKKNTTEDSEKENISSTSPKHNNEPSKIKLKKDKHHEPSLNSLVSVETNESTVTIAKLKKNPKKTLKEPKESDKTESSTTECSDASDKKQKKKKKKAKPNAELISSDGEPQKKTSKIDPKPEIITKDLQNLNIGDNPHTLSNLLDDMVVVDKKNKKNKNKDSQKGGKKTEATSTSSTDTLELEEIVEGKEKVKWKKRKWNKDKKGDIDEEINTSVIVENLPLSIMPNYKKLLSDHFGTFGLIKKIGVAEVYPTEEPKPVFTTTVYYCNPEAATKALEVSTMLLQGCRIRVKRPLPATETTIVVRSYADLNEQALSTAFLKVGRIRNIRQLVKGKKTMSTAFVEFDGPAAVERALAHSEDARIAGKKIYVSKYEERRAKKTKMDTQSENGQTKQDSSSDTDDN